MKIISKRTAQILLAVSLTTLFWVGYEAGLRGLDADKNGTAGYTTNLEIVGVLLSIILVGFSIYVILASRHKKSSDN